MQYKNGIQILLHLTLCYELFIVADFFYGGCRMFFRSYCSHFFTTTWTLSASFRCKWWMSIMTTVEILYTYVHRDVYRFLTRLRKTSLCRNSNIMTLKVAYIIGSMNLWLWIFMKSMDISTQWKLFCII